MIAHKVECLYCLVFHIVFLVMILFVLLVVFKTCKSFDRKKTVPVNIKMFKAFRDILKQNAIGSIKNT